MHFLAKQKKYLYAISFFSVDFLTNPNKHCLTEIFDKSNSQSKTKRASKSFKNKAKLFNLFKTAHVGKINLSRFAKIWQFLNLKRINLIQFAAKLSSKQRSKC